MKGQEFSSIHVLPKDIFSKEQKKGTQGTEITILNPDPQHWIYLGPPAPPPLPSGGSAPPPPPPPPGTLCVHHYAGIKQNS